MSDINTTVTKDAFAPLTSEESIHAQAQSSNGAEEQIQFTTATELPPLDTFNSTFGRNPDFVWPYHNAAGKIMVVVARWDRSDGKDIRNFAPALDAEGKMQWIPKRPKGSLPLFNLPSLLVDTQRPVLIVEGEKAADAAAKLCPNFIVSTWLGGAANSAHVDWSSLANLDVVIWPDADEPGRQAATEIQDKLIKIKASCTVLNLKALGTFRAGFLKENSAGVDTLTASASELPGGYDAADALNEGLTPRALRRFLRRNAAYEAPVSVLPRKYDFTEGGHLVYIVKEAANNQMPEQERIGQRLDVHYRARDENSSQWSHVVSFRDPDQRLHHKVIALDTLVGRGGDAVALLMQDGYRLYSSSAATLLLNYLHAAVPYLRKRLQNCPGWTTDGAYTLNDAEGTTIAQYQPPSAYHLIKPSATPSRQSGTLDQWKALVAANCVGNSRLILAVSAVFAAPLLHLTNNISLGFHLYGSSSSGKSTILRVAHSVIGGDMVNWRVTDNGLEGIAAQRNDGPMILDELGQVEARDITKIVYMLGNGQGKGRANQHGQARRAVTFRNSILSSGELTVEQHAASAGERIKAGVELRLLNISADAGRGMGCFENIHQIGDSRTFADNLKAATANQHGTAWPVWIEHLVEDRNTVCQRLQELQQSFFSAHTQHTDDGQIKRAAMMFGLVAAAGELATEAGLTGWPAGTSNAAVSTCFKEWISTRESGVYDQELVAAIQQLQAKIIELRETKFGVITGRDGIPTQALRECHGWKIISEPDVSSTPGTSTPGVPPVQTVSYLLTASTWKSYLVGFDHKAVAKFLHRKGFLSSDASGKRFDLSTRIPGTSTPIHCYRLKESFLSLDLASEGRAATHNQVA